MAAADTQSMPAEPAPTVPDYLASPNAVLGDKIDSWRYGKAPDYTNTRKVWAETKQMNHTAGSLPQLVENLVKNWEVEASFKKDLKDWRTIDHSKYTFAINGGPPQSAEHMLEVGTYNAIIAPNEYYSPESSNFASSHKTFKRMMPTFAWEVLEVYSGPPQVSFRWRHWGTMKNDYVGFNDDLIISPYNSRGEKVTAKAHGGVIDIQGVTVATVDDSVRLQSVQTWFDPMEMFRQVAPNGIVNKQIITPAEKASAQADETAEEGNSHSFEPKTTSTTSTSAAEATATGAAPQALPEELPTSQAHLGLNVRADDQVDAVTGSGSGLEDKVEAAQHPTVEPGNAIAGAPEEAATTAAHEEMAAITPAQCPFMNRE